MPPRPRKRPRNGFDRLIGSPLYEPEAMDLHMSAEALALVKAAMAKLEGRAVVDYHCHLAGIGRGSACCGPLGSNPLCRTYNHAKVRVFMSAFGVPPDGEDAEVAERLARLVRHTHPRLQCVLLPFDRRYDRESGAALHAETPLYVPNDFVDGVRRSHPEVFAAACSVHPYRPDAVEELERCHRRGARICKWLPNSMLIDPSDPACDRFYEACVRLDIAILCHTGDETSVDFPNARVDNALGNPLLLRRPLRRGVKVIAAHCASEGSATDDRGRRRECFELLTEMMLDGESSWSSLLFADISALIIFKRAPKLLRLLETPQLFDRLVYGSDYPIPALGGRIVGTSAQPLALLHGGAFGAQLVKLGLLSAAQAAALEEVFNYNPLLFDLVLKLTVSHPKTGAQLPASVFSAHPLLPPSGQDLTARV